MPMSDADCLRQLMDERDTRYQQRFDDQTQAISAALLAAEKAVTKAEAASEKRFDAVNEFRGALADQARLLVNRTEVEAWREQLREAQAALSARIQRIEGKSIGMNAGWTILIAAGGLVAAVVAIFYGTHT
jgi:CHASE3 domain sensor protein